MLPLKHTAGHLGTRSVRSKYVVRPTHSLRRSVAERIAYAATREAQPVARSGPSKRGLASRLRRVAEPAPERAEEQQHTPEVVDTATTTTIPVESHVAAEEHDGATTAALRDATATASPSGHDHLAPNGHAHALPRQHALRAGAALSASSAGAAVEAAAGAHAAHFDGDSNGDAEAGAAEATEPAPAAPAQPAPGLWMPPHLTSERDKDIHDELHACEDVRDVLDVLADEVPHLSLRTGVQALTRLNALSRGNGAARAELVQAPAFKAMLEHLLPRVPLMNNVQLSNSLQACAQLRVELSGPLLSSYYEAALARVDSFYPRDIATFVQAVGALRCAPPQQLLDALSFRAKSFMATGEFDGRCISTLLHSCVLLGYKNPILAAAAAERLAGPGVLAGMAPQSVANSLWALGRMGCYNPATVAAALEAFLSAPLAYKPQECANLLWALTAFRHHPEGAFLAFARSLLHHEQSLRAADVATLLYSLATFNVAPGPAVWERLERRAAAMLAARAVNGVELCNMYWGLSLLGQWERPLFGQLERALAEHAEAGGDFPPSLQRMVFQGFLAARLGNEAQRPPPFSALTWDAVKRAWYNDVMDYASVGAARPTRGGGAAKGSRFLDSAVRPVITEILRELRVRHDQSRVTGDGLAVIDFALKAGPDRYVALQVLESADRCANSKQLLGTVKLQRQLLEKNGWEVRFLVAKDLMSLAPEARPLFVAELLRQAGVRTRRARPEDGAAEGGAAGAAGDAAEQAGGPRSRAAAREVEVLSNLDGTQQPRRGAARRGGR